VRRLGVVALACALVGCTPSAGPPVRERDAAATPTPVRGKVLGGERIARAIAWPDAAEIDAEVRASLPASARAQADAAPVPLLAPLDPALALAAHVSRGSTWASLATRSDAFTITLHASGEARLVPGVRAVRLPHRVRGLPALVTFNEGAWSASWIERGVAYDLSIECARPDAPDCTADSVIALANSLVAIATEGSR
jgi:hypothetical protein